MLNDMADGKCCFRFSDSFDSNSVPQNLENVDRKISEEVRQSVATTSACEFRPEKENPSEKGRKQGNQKVSSSDHICTKITSCFVQGKTDCPRKDKENIVF